MRRNAPDRDRDWLEQLFDEHSRRLRAFAIRRVGVDDADDIVSEVVRGRGDDHGERDPVAGG